MHLDIVVEPKSKEEFENLIDTAEAQGIDVYCLTKIRRVQGYWNNPMYLKFEHQTEGSENIHLIGDNVIGNNRTLVSTEEFMLNLKS